MRRADRLITVSVAAMSLASFARGQAADVLKVPPIPQNLQVPAGHIPFLTGHAVGTQNYVCRPSGESYAWTPFGPQATLFVTIKLFSGEIRQQIMTHFLSLNPAEDNTARATWQSSFDTSAVWARAIQTSTDPMFVAPGAVAWLLLEKVGSQRGPAGGDSLMPTTFIQRLNTSGGVAPSSGCSESNVGGTVLVPYSTDYFFYRAVRTR